LAVDLYVVREAIRDPRCGVLFPCHGALAVKMGCRLVRAQILKDWAQAAAAADFLSGDRVSAVDVDEELGVRGEEGHLAHDVPAVCAMSISVDKFAYGKAIGNFLQGQITGSDYRVRLL
jgi:hypothetical protein